MPDETTNAAAATPETAAGATPTVPTTPPPAPAAPAGGGGAIQLTKDEYRQLLEDRQLAEQHRQAEVAKVQKAESERLKALAEKEGIEAALRKIEADRAESDRKHKEEVTSYQTRLLDYHKRTELGRHLLGVAWVSDEAARDAEAKIAAQFETVDVGGQAVTRQIGTGKPPAEAIPELLKTPAYLHFQAGKAGGAGAGATNRSGETASADPKERAREIIAQALQARNSDAIGLSGIGRAPATN
jgi:hypothetical protein